MHLKRKLTRLAIVSMILMVTGLIGAFARYPQRDPGAMVDEHWYHIIISDDEAMTAAATHDIDAMGVPRPADLDWFLYDPATEPYGWTITSTTRSGYTFTMENNRVWPFGTPNGSPADADNWRCVYLRKAVHRLIDKKECTALYIPLMSEAEAWLPPALEYWVDPDIALPAFNPIEAAEMLDDGGWVEGTKSNPYYDPAFPASAEHLRIDPVLGGDVSFEFYTIGPTESPIGYEMAILITGWLRKAGLTVDLVAGTWLGIVFRLVNDDLYDYQLMTGVGITHGLPPDILYAYTYHENLPLWNFAGMNISDLNDAGRKLMSTLDKQEARDACFEMQIYLRDYEPYLPLLLWEMYAAYTDPYGVGAEAEPGYIGIVNMPSFGGLASQNSWGKRFGRCDRYEGPTHIDKIRQGAYLDTLNPLTADTVPDWQVLTTCMGGHYDYNAYTLQENYMWLAATGAPTIEKWIGPGGADVTGPGNGVYDADVTYVEGELATYNYIPVDLVTADDLQGDDTLGMKTTWTIKPDLYWHDSDPGPDLKFGTADDGVVYPVTAEDYKFGMELLIEQDNVRYYSDITQFVYDVGIKSTYSYTVYEERRFLWAFEVHGVGYLTPKHIWEPWIAGDDGVLWTDDDRDHRHWFGWEEKYMIDPVREHLGLTTHMWLTKLIGFGPYVYHYGGWAPGQYAHIEANPVYYYAIYGSEPLIGDVDLNGLVAGGDMYIIVRTMGLHPNVNPKYDERGDIVYPAQTIDLTDLHEAIEQFGLGWYP